MGRLETGVGLLLLISSSVANAAAEQSKPTGISMQQFLHECDSPLGVGYGLCVGFFQGIMAETNLARIRQGKTPCDFSTKTVGEFIDSLRDYTKQHPEALEEKADAIIDQTVQTLCS